MRVFSLLVAAAVSATSHAGFNWQSYDDSFNDLFDNSMSNLDIGGCNVEDDGVNITFTVETRSFESWTKYMLFIDTAAGGTTSNAWSRPINLTSNIDYFIGSWVDQTTSNSQLVGWDGAGWNWGAASTFTNQHYLDTNIVSWTVSLASLGLVGGELIYFDVATSGGGSGDPGVDHLSLVGAQSTSGWGSPSTSGNFLSYQVSGVPAPGAIALLGLAGLLGRRRR